MKFIIAAKKLEITPAIRERIEKKIGKLDKYFHSDVEAHVTVKTHKERQIVEVTIHCGGLLLRAEEESNDLYHSIDRVVDVLERQIRKHKTRLAKRLHSEPILAAPYSGETVDEEEIFEVVKVKTIDMKPMTSEEAILQMNLLGHAFFVFADADSGKFSVIYKRQEGGYGLIGQK